MSYSDGFRAARYSSPLDRLREDWQFQPPYNKSRIDDTYFRRGMIDGRRSLGRPSPGQELLLRQVRRMPLEHLLQEAVEEGVLRTGDRKAREEALLLKRAFASIREKLQRIREIELQERIQRSLSGIPEFDPSWDYL